MSGNKKKHHTLNTISVKSGCTSRISALFRRRPRRRHHRPSPTTDTPPASDMDSSSSIKSLGAVEGFGRVGGESVAVEKDSDDPYLDFRRSMLQMILEKELYSKDDLKHLLNCFLQLNSPYYHGVIIRAFMEIWNGVYSVRPSASPNVHGTCTFGDC